MASEIFKALSTHFSFGGIDTDNWAFKLFSKVSVGIFMAASVASIASKYTGGAIECTNKDNFILQYCWLHGTNHLPIKELEVEINNGDLCFMEHQEPDNKDGPDTQYYLWVSLTLFISGISFMIPGKIWEYYEGGMLEQFGSTRNQFLNNPSKHGEIFNKLSKNHTTRYFFVFIACESMNYLLAILNFLMINCFLNGNFLTYGYDVMSYYTGNGRNTEIQLDRE